MKSVIVPAPGKIEIREVETPVINAYQALVKTRKKCWGFSRSMLGYKLVYIKKIYYYIRYGKIIFLFYFFV